MGKRDLQNEIVCAKISSTEEETGGGSRSDLAQSQVQRRVKFGVRRCCFRMLCSFLGGCALIPDAQCHCDPTRTPVLQVVGHTRLERERNNNDESNENEYEYEENIHIIPMSLLRAKLELQSFTLKQRRGISLDRLNMSGS